MSDNTKDKKEIVPISVVIAMIAMIIGAGILPYFVDPNLKGATIGNPRLANPYVKATINDRLVLIYYFYWYDWATGMHFYDPTCPNHNRYQIYNKETVSYLNPDWHYREFKDMMQAGIDVLLPVFWAGNPGSGLNDSWSKQGVYVMNLALDRLTQEWIAAGKPNPLGVMNPVPKVGMFFDTTAMCLEYNRGLDDCYGDLTNETHCNTFYQMIRDFFIALKPEYIHEVVNPDNATAPAGYIVWMYGSNWFKRVDQSCIDKCKERFIQEFNKTLVFVGTDSWRKGCPDLEGYYKWGTAVTGWRSYDYSPIRIASLGPGFDNGNASIGAVCQVGQDPIYTPRSPEYYSSNWTATITDDPNWIVIETWNEMHEGTPICRTEEFGDLYINLTAQFSKVFHAKPIDSFRFLNFIKNNWAIFGSMVCVIVVLIGAVQAKKRRNPV